MTRRQFTALLLTTACADTQPSTWDEDADLYTPEAANEGGVAEPGFQANPHGEQTRDGAGLATSPMGFSAVDFTLTDAPGEVEAVPLTVEGVDLLPCADSIRTDRGPWIPALQNQTRWDLLKLQDGVTGPLGSTEVVSGSYCGVRLLVSDIAVVTSAGVQELELSRRLREGLPMPAAMRLEPDRAYEVRIDFDAKESLLPFEEGFRLDPVLSVEAIPLDRLDGDTGR